MSVLLVVWAFRRASWKWITLRTDLVLREHQGWDVLTDYTRNDDSQIKKAFDYYGSVCVAFQSLALLLRLRPFLRCVLVTLTCSRFPAISLSAKAAATGFAC